MSNSGAYRHHDNAAARAHGKFSIFSLSPLNHPPLAPRLAPSCSPSLCRPLHVACPCHVWPIGCRHLPCHFCASFRVFFSFEKSQIPEIRDVHVVLNSARPHPRHAFGNEPWERLAAHTYCSTSPTQWNQTKTAPLNLSLDPGALPQSAQGRGRQGNQHPTSTTSALCAQGGINTTRKRIPYPTALVTTPRRTAHRKETLR